MLSQFFIEFKIHFSVYCREINKLLSIQCPCNFWSSDFLFDMLVVEFKIYLFQIDNEIMMESLLYDSIQQLKRYIKLMDNNDDLYPKT